MVRIITSDKVTLEVDKEIIKSSQVIREMLEHLGESNDEIPLENVDGATMKKIIEYMEYHKDDAEDAVERDPHNEMNNIVPWDKDFADVERDSLFAIFVAANYLNIQRLLKLCAITAAKRVQSMSADAIKEFFYKAAVDEPATKMAKVSN